MGAQEIEFEKLSGGFFLLEIPKGWELATAGTCGDFAFLARNPSEPMRKVFYFGQVGPVYITRYQRDTDRKHIAQGNVVIPWIEMPVVDPPSPSNLLGQFHLIAATQIAQSFMPWFPALEGFKVVSFKRQASPVQGGRTELVRGVFKEGEKAGEGLFMATVVPLMDFTAGPGKGTAWGVLISGVTAPKGEFGTLEDSLVKTLGSLSMSQDHVNICVANNEVMFTGTMKAGNALKETSDIMAEGWQKRSQAEDILAEKLSDEILGKER